MQTLASVALSDVSPKAETPKTSCETTPSQSEARLQDLIPIVMVIVGGCEPCAEKMVARALAQGSSWQDIDKTLRIIADLQRRDCFANAVGAAVLARMEKPLEAGLRTLRQATPAART